MTAEVAFTLKLSLTVQGFEGSPEKITEIMGCAPTDAFPKGTIHRKGMQPTGFGQWHLDAPLSPENSSISDQLESLRSLLPDPTVIQRLPDGVVMWVGCVVNAYEYWPTIYFNAEEIAYLRELSAGIDVDIYDQRNV